MIEVLYGIAKKGIYLGQHGEYHFNNWIQKVELHGSDEFPPLFLTKEDAEEYIRENKIYESIPVELRIFHKSVENHSNCDKIPFDINKKLTFEGPIAFRMSDKISLGLVNDNCEPFDP